MANSVPTLTGLTTPVTFLENTVNGAPQIIAADVTFTDPDNNFDGGTLTVTGLLAQDTVAIRNQGSGAGQIGISGSNVTFGGILIGSFAGGAGSTLAVTFNASATAQGIEALIENLTYANSSDTPTASRSLELKVTDAAGFAALAPLADRRRQSGWQHRCRLPERADPRRPRRRRRPRHGRRRHFWQPALLQEHRHGHRTGLQPSERRRQSVQRRRHRVEERADLRRPRRRRRPRRHHRRRCGHPELLQEHRHGHRAGVQPAVRRRQSVRHRRSGRLQHAGLRRPRR